MSNLNIELEELKKSHLNRLKSLFNSDISYDNKTDDDVLSIENKNLKEYFESISNMLDYQQNKKSEVNRISKLKTNDKQNQALNKVFNTNYNLEYCEFCKLAYWPNNCRVHMVKINILKFFIKLIAYFIVLRFLRLV